MNTNNVFLAQGL